MNDYLPAEFNLFDLCIMDEASQSDITALPSMLRGKQWMIVGDGRQVSPTESFTAEAQIETLRASLPDSPFRECFLPGHSFFDLCSQAYCIGRVVLTEHFRSAPEIIQFSNETYYQDRLQPLRLPTSSEAMSPSLVDIYVRNGRKIGKTNEAEADRIVAMVQDLVEECKRQRRSRPKSIGVISLVGDEQSRLIRGRLLDAIGPEAYNLHDILVGEPPSFQGSERDVVFLSMVSSPGSVPTQSQLMYHQRINVALSRARDRMVLVRSINRSHVPSNEDAKVAVIDYFSEHALKDLTKDIPTMRGDASEAYPGSFLSDSIHSRVIKSLSERLSAAGFVVRPMGVVWRGAVCIENTSSGARAAIALENSGEVEQEWSATLTQQRAIERVGWICARIDTLSWLLDLKATEAMLLSFLKSAGVTPMKQKAIDAEGEEESNDEVSFDSEEDNQEEDDDDASTSGGAAAENARGMLADEVVVISTDDEGGVNMEMSDATDSEKVKKEDDGGSDNDSDSDDDDDGYDPQNYGNVIQLGAPPTSARANLADRDDESDDGSDLDVKPKAKGKRKRAEESTEQASDNNDGMSNGSEDERTEPSPRKRRRGASGGGRVAMDGLSDADYQGDESDESYHEDDEMSEEDLADDGNMSPTHKCRRRYKRLDAHSRDGRWYPSYAPDNGDVPMEGTVDESWNDLKDVVPSNVSTQNDGGLSVTSRLRSSVPSQETNQAALFQEDRHYSSDEDSVIIVEESSEQRTNEMDADMEESDKVDGESSEQVKVESSIISSEITIPEGYSVKQDKVSLL